jgi:hypothetical protein
MTSDNESAYKIMIDRGDFNKQPAQRQHRTKELLSGGFGQKRSQPGLSQPSLMDRLTHDQNSADRMQGMGQVQQQLYKPQPQWVGESATNMNPGSNSNNNANNMNPSPQPKWVGDNATNMNPGNNSNNNANNMNPSNNPQHLQTIQTPNWPNPGIQQPPSFNYPAQDYSAHNRNNQHNAASETTRNLETKPWYEKNSHSSEEGESRKSTRRFNRFWQKSDSESSRSSRRSGRRYDRSSRHRSKQRGKYDISDSESGNDYCDSTRLNSQQKKVLLDTIKEHCPDTMHSMVYEDVLAQMEQLDKQGYKLPQNYDKRKHDLDTNEIRLYEQQVMRDKQRDLKKMSYILNFSALGLNGFCQCMNFDWIKTKHLPKMIREGIDDGDFDDCLEGIGMYLRGTIFDNPVFSTVLKFVEKVGESHQTEVEEEQEKLEDEEERRDHRNASALKSMHKFRGGGFSSSSFSSDENSDTTLPFDVKPPKSLPGSKSRPVQGKKTK